MLVFRLPYIIGGITLTIPEASWMIVGQAMNNGKMMYQDIWHDIGPFSAFVYQVVDLLFGQSQLAYQLLSILLVFAQAAIFNRLLLINKAFNENSYVPALIYVTCMSANFEFLTLSPMLMSITFMLLAINNIFKRIDNFTKDELFLYTGLYLGASTLFYFPSFVFFISTLLSLILFTSAIPRRLILMTFGYLQVLGVAALYYYWHDTGREFYFQFLTSAFWLERLHFLNGQQLFRISLCLGVFLLISFFKLYSRNYYVNFQVKFQSVILLSLVAAFGTLFLQPRLSATHLIAFIPGVAFFLSHLFLLIEKKFKAEILFLVFLITLFTYQQLIDKELKWIGQLVDYSDLQITMPDDVAITNKKVLVLGDNLGYYTDNSLATPYLNWQLSQLHLNNLDYYDTLTEVFDNFNEDPPEVIIDISGMAPALFSKMPTIGSKYLRSGSLTYVLK